MNAVLFKKNAKIYTLQYSHFINEKNIYHFGLFSRIIYYSMYFENLLYAPRYFLVIPQVSNNVKVLEISALRSKWTNFLLCAYS